ncbi:MAG: hypothetical protein ABIR10_10220 [Dokdonella sp.]
MAQLATGNSPAASLPRRFLLSMPLWGMLAGGLLMVGGDALLRSRWTAVTLALVHIFTLGVLGNAMLRSLLQFLPVAAGVQVRGNVTVAPWLHGLFNLGVLALVAGLHQEWQPALITAALLLPLAFLLIAAMTLPGLLAGARKHLVRAGFGMAIVFALITAWLGGALALMLGGQLALPLMQSTDVHASFGVLGWVIVLIATVARVVMPMFQGTDSVPAPAQATWLCSVLLTLPAASWWYYAGGSSVWLAGVVAVHTLLFAGAALWLQWRAPRLRRTPLMWSWRVGLLGLALAALALPGGMQFGLLSAVLALGLALPLLVLGMAQEIVAFVEWIDMRKQCHAVPVPGVHQLLPERDKKRVLLTQLPLWCLLPAAALWPSAWLARMAGLALMVVWLGVSLTLLGVRRRARRFLLRDAIRRVNFDVAQS